MRLQKKYRRTRRSEKLSCHLAPRTLRLIHAKGRKSLVVWYVRLIGYRVLHAIFAAFVCAGWVKDLVHNVKSVARRGVVARVVVGVAHVVAHAQRHVAVAPTRARDHNSTAGHNGRRRITAPPFREQEFTQTKRAALDVGHPKEVVALTIVLVRVVAALGFEPREARNPAASRQGSRDKLSTFVIGLAGTAGHSLRARHVSAIPVPVCKRLHSLAALHIGRTGAETRLRSK